jgi:hypothetical protein
LNLQLVPGPLNEHEQRLVEEFYRTRYTRDEWNCRV